MTRPALDPVLRRRITAWFDAPILGHGLMARYQDARGLLRDVLAGGDVLDEECSTCAEGGYPKGECPASRRPCGHHCNCSWVHDCCHWCGGEYAEASDGDSVWLTIEDLRRARVRAVLAEHGHVSIDDLDQVVADVLEAVGGVGAVPASVEAHDDGDPFAEWLDHGEPVG